MEEFDSAAPPLEGASTSTAGFIGMAQRGPVKGLPKLVTSFNDFQRIYGGYLSKKEFGSYRFLAYAVEHFFLNGGSRCYVMRVAPHDAAASQNLLPAGQTEDKAALKFTAKNPGTWGNQIRVTVRPDSKAKTPILELQGAGNQYKVKSSAGFYAGDIVVFKADGKTEYRQVVFVQDNVIELNEALSGGDSVIDTSVLPIKTLESCEFSVQVNFGAQEELYERCSFNVEAPTHVEKVLSRSQLVDVKDLLAEREETPEIKAPFQLLTAAVAGEATTTPVSTDEDETEGETPATPVVTPAAPAKKQDDKVALTLAGGKNGTVIEGQVPDEVYTGIDPAGNPKGPGERQGLDSFNDNDEVSIMAIPGVTKDTVQVQLVAHCENLKSRFAILDIPEDKTQVEDVKTHRFIFDTSYGAVYHPWLKVNDPLDKRIIDIPPSGSMAGVFSRSDQTRGVHKAPANEVVRGCVGLSVQYNKGEQDVLNPLGVNLIRSFPGQGIRVWGARTMSSNGLWKYVNVRRLFIFLEESIKSGTNWVVFEPNDDKLWARVQRTIDTFLTRVWRDGALMGASPEEAFYVQVGRSTMTQDDIDNGRLICVIGVSPVKPAEFVIFRITQKTNEE